jgi:hypothetical protein
VSASGAPSRRPSSHLLLVHRTQRAEIFVVAIPRTWLILPGQRSKTTRSEYSANRRWGRVGLLHTQLWRHMTPIYRSQVVDPGRFSSTVLRARSIRACFLHGRLERGLERPQYTVRPTCTQPLNSQHFFHVCFGAYGIPRHSDVEFADRRRATGSGFTAERCQKLEQDSVSKAQYVAAWKDQ